MHASTECGEKQLWQDLDWDAVLFSRLIKDCMANQFTPMPWAQSANYTRAYAAQIYQSIILFM